MAGRSNEVEACVDTQVNLVLAARLLLLEHVRLVLVVEELDDGHPRVFVVDIVAEARGVDDGEADCNQDQVNLGDGTKSVWLGKGIYP